MRQRAGHTKRNSGLLILELWPFEVEYGRIWIPVVSAL